MKLTVKQTYHFKSPEAWHEYLRGLNGTVPDAVMKALVEGQAAVAELSGADGTTAKFSWNTDWSSTSFSPAGVIIKEVN